MLINRLPKFITFKLIVAIRSIKYSLLKLKAKNGYLVKNVQGSKMKLDLNDEGISKDLAVDGIREPGSTKIMKDFIKQGDVAVDIGANLGYYALMESRLVGSNGKVYAIEPSPSNFEALKENIKLNGYKNIECYKLGIGDKKETAKMFISSHSNLNSLVIQKNKKIIDNIDIQITSLNDFIKGKEFPDFIRMDVEGYEYNIIKGMNDLLKSKKPLKLFIELHPHIMTKDKTTFVLESLMKSGFEVEKVLRSFTVPEMKVKNRKEYDYSSMSILDILNDESIVNGKKGALEMFFKREVQFKYGKK